MSRYCPNCGMPVSENARFCKNCGQKLRVKPKSAQTPAVNGCEDGEKTDINQQPEVLEEQYIDQPDQSSEKTKMDIPRMGMLFLSLCLLIGAFCYSKLSEPKDRSDDH